MFDGIAVLVGIDPYLIEQKKPPTSRYINEFVLIQKAKELKFHYCFKILNSQKDIIGLGYEVTFGGDHYFVSSNG